MSEIWCNGGWLPAANYPGAALDRGAFLGLGLFETMGAVEGTLMFAERHLARIRKGCERFGWEFGLPDLEGIAAGLLARNGLSRGRARIRLIVTAGSGAHDDLAPGPDRLVWLAAFPGGPVPDGLNVCLSPWPRNERSPLAGLKSACYAENLIALDHARRGGFQETLFLNTRGELCESATANVFLVSGGVLLTPPPESGCLPGVGREVVLELAAALGIPIGSRHLYPVDLAAADEIFLTSATRGPMAVTGWHERELSAGPITRRLRDAWDALMEPV